MTGRSSLRDNLKAATHQLHSTLDNAMAPLVNGARYGQLLSIQAIARRPIEGWLAGQEALPSPPRQLPLLEADLAELGIVLTTTGQALSFHPLNEDEAWGIAWAVAGSSLGNRAMLHALRRAGVAGPFRFLADEAMPRYWTELRTRIDQPADEVQTRHAVTGARRVFDHFLACHALAERKVAA